METPCVFLHMFLEQRSDHVGPHDGVWSQRGLLSPAKSGLRPAVSP